VLLFAASLALWRTSLFLSEHPLRVRQWLASMLQL
jgi:hypothetical protein